MAKGKKSGGCFLSAFGGVVIVLVVLAVIVSSLGGKDTGDVEENQETIISQDATEEVVVGQDATKEAVTNVEVTKEGNPIDDFFYSISNDKVMLESCNTHKETLTIQSSYEIDGKEYETDLSNFQVGGNSVKTLILSEGITEVKDSIFNSSDVQRVFFPKSMEIVYDNTLAYLSPKDENTVSIYYAGTQEEWALIFTEYKRTKVEDAEFGEEMGQAVADKLNEMMGHKYDSSLFSYYFSAKPDDLK